MTDFNKILLTAVFAVIGGIILIYAEEYVRQNNSSYRDPVTDTLSIDTPPTPQSPPSPVVPPPSQTFDIKINYVVRRKNTPQRAENIQLGETLHFGDSYKIIFEPQQDAYIYIFQKGSSGNIFRLYPRDSWGETKLNLNNPVTAQQTYYVPTQQNSFILDTTAGTETFYLLAFSEKQHELEQTYNKMLAAADATSAQKYRGQLEERIKTYRDPLITLSTDGEEGVTWTEEQTRYEVVRQKLEDLCDACVNVFSFQHQ